MTIAIGILASDGLVVAADTQETMGTWKLKHGKVSAMVAADQTPKADGKSRRSCLVTGAGQGHHIDVMSRTLLNTWGKNKAWTDAQMKQSFNDSLHEFYGKHVLPFAAYPAEDRPDFQLVVGCNWPSPTLLVSEGNLFKVVWPFVAVGIGCMVATTLLTRFYKSPMLDVRSAVLLASYVMFHVKDSQEGCGKDTDIAGIADGEFFMLSRKETKALEDAMQEFSSDVEPAVFRAVTDIETHAQPKAATRARARLKKLATKLRLG